MMTAVHPAAIDAALPSLDAEVACEAIACSHPEHQCQTPARWRIRMHGARDEADHRAARCSTFALPVCDPHLGDLKRVVADDLARHNHPLRCTGCGAEFAQVSDVILEVHPL
ncbi:hypothetical protein [Gordonia soli]|uniref:Uncharacterized protein n=1 Tax=Gordonia soli NBRC 108243 TaxID=1223545 RepID=M0QQE5_9ACTN|nr:hypothetical protein [Gordonia soli]GAC70803.1 hypothetical protein GS4_41_00500 [Gordonia soli NBRC 108243]